MPVPVIDRIPGFPRPLERSELSLCNALQEYGKRDFVTVLYGHVQDVIIFPITSFRILPATVAVSSETSRAGLYSTMSAPTIVAVIECRCSSTSRTDIPPGSRCETPGANAGSSTSMSKETYTGHQVFTSSSARWWPIL